MPLRKSTPQSGGYYEWTYAPTFYLFYIFPEKIMDDSIEINKKFKIERTLEKIEAKKLKRLESEKKKYEKLFNEQADKLKTKYDKRLERRRNKILRDYDRKRIDTKKKLQGKPVKPQQTKIWKLSQLAYKLYQKRRKLSLADDKGMVQLADMWTFVHRSEAVAGHVRWKHNNPHMIFLDLNVRCITRQTNRRQGDTPGIWWAQKVLSVEQMAHLLMLSENKELKNQIRDRSYFQEKIDCYEMLIRKETERLWKYFEKIPWQTNSKSV